MNAFEKHGIKHLSASSLNLFRGEPALWCLRYLMGVKDDAGPAAWRGSAVEAGLDHWLYKRELGQATQVAQSHFMLKAEGEFSDENAREYAFIAPMLKIAADVCGALPIPTATQLKCELWLDGVSVPLVGYIDYVFEDHLLDLKSTQRCPSEAKSDHARQVSIYCKSRNQTGKLLYVTDKRFASYPVENVEDHIRDLTIQARALEKLLSKCDSGQEFASLHCPDYSRFYWSNPETLKAAQALWTL